MASRGNSGHWLGMAARWVVLAMGLAVGSGCSTNPVTGASNLNLMTTEQEIAIGVEQYLPSQQQQGGSYVTDPELNAYIRNVGQRLVDANVLPPLPYEFIVLNNGVPNAWALPGGKIAINRGLLVELEDESQLAAVLGHEIVHAAASHGAQQMSQGMLLQAGTAVVAVAAADSEYGALAVIGAGIGAQAWQAQYSQSNELESDHYGMRYMAKAGYDPYGAVELQETFVRLSEGQQSNFLSDFFASHPPSQTRVDANRELAAQLPKGKRNRREYERAMERLNRDEPAYAAYEEGLKALNDKDYDKALSLANQAIARQSRETLFWQLKGLALVQSDKSEQALSAFNKAVEAHPEFFSPLLYRGLVRKQLGKNNLAAQDIEGSLKLLPTQLGMYHMGELAQARGDNGSARQYYEAASQGGGELATAAKARLSEMGL